MCERAREGCGKTAASTTLNHQGCNREPPLTAPTTRAVLRHYQYAARQRPAANWGHPRHQPA